MGTVVGAVVGTVDPPAVVVVVLAADATKVVSLEITDARRLQDAQRAVVRWCGQEGHRNEPVVPQEGARSCSQGHTCYQRSSCSAAPHLKRVPEASTTSSRRHGRACPHTSGRPGTGARPVAASCAALSVMPMEEANLPRVAFLPAADFTVGPMVIIPGSLVVMPYGSLLVGT